MHASRRSAANLNHSFLAATRDRKRFANDDVSHHPFIQLSPLGALLWDAWNQRHPQDGS